MLTRPKALNQISFQEISSLISIPHFKKCLLFIVLFALCNGVFAQLRVNDEDASYAEVLSRKYKDDDVICTSAHHYFTFDKGKNSLNDKVVVIEEEAELEFLALKKYASLTYPEFYNKFIDLKTFKKTVKVGTRYATSRMPPFLWTDR